MLDKKNRLFLQLSYNGTNYHGWQRQPKVSSVQQTIEDNLKTLFNRDISCIGCGRTDAGVHAHNFFAHIDIYNSETLKVKRMNMLLPKDIFIKDFIFVNAKNHAQYDAIKRTYSYNFHLSKSPFLSATSTLYDVKEYDLDKIEEAFFLLKDQTEFLSFCKTPSNYKNTNCKIYQLEFNRSNSSQFNFTITANRFLRGMIRYLVASLMDVGSGNLLLANWKKVLAGRIDLKYRTAAPPQGLSLIDVEYPNNTLNQSMQSVFEA